MLSVPGCMILGDSFHHTLAKYGLLLVLGFWLFGKGEAPTTTLTAVLQTLPIQALNLNSYKPWANTLANPNFLESQVPT